MKGKANEIEIIGPIAKIHMNNTDKCAIVDADDVEKVKQHIWYIKHGEWQGYVRAAVEGHKEISLHRFIMGVMDPKIHVDHINGDILDNRKKNLREANNCLNHANQKIRKDNRAGYKGVHYCRGKYHARIGPAGKMFLGSFDTAKEAAKAYDAKAKELYGPFAKLNFPDPEEKHLTGPGPEAL